MLAISSSVRIFLYQNPVDMRNGFEGLSTVVQSDFEEKLTSGAFFVFINKKCDYMKILYWDTDGLAIWCKRLEKGRFVKRNSKPLLSRREFFLLLEGIKPKSMQRRFTNM